MGLVERLEELDHRVGIDTRRFWASPGRARWLLAWCCCWFLVVAALAVAAWNGDHDRRVARQLRDDGVRVEGQVVEYRSRVGRLQFLLGESVKVAFTTVDGQAVQTWITTNQPVEFGPAAVVYLRTDPSIARLAHDMEPRAGAIASVLILSGGVGGFFLAFWLCFRAIDRKLGLRS